MSEEENNKVISILLKEIERLESENEPLKENVKLLIDTKEYLEDQLQKTRHKIFILEDKIKEKIKDLKENDNGDDYSLTNVIMILKKLLEEGE